MESELERDVCGRTKEHGLLEPIALIYLRLAWIRHVLICMEQWWDIFTMIVGVVAWFVVVKRQFPCHHHENWLRSVLKRQSIIKRHTYNRKRKKNEQMNPILAYSVAYQNERENKTKHRPQPPRETTQRDIVNKSSRSVKTRKRRVQTSESSRLA